MQAISYCKDGKEYPAYPVSSPTTSPGLISRFIGTLAPCAPKTPTIQSLEQDFATAYKTVYQDDVLDPAVIVAEALAYTAICPMQNSKSIYACWHWVFKLTLVLATRVFLRDYGAQVCARSSHQAGQLHDCAQL